MCKTFIQYITCILAAGRWAPGAWCGGHKWLPEQPLIHLRIALLSVGAHRIRPALEIRGIICASSAFVQRDLRVRAQRPCRLAIFPVMQDCIRRSPVFHPGHNCVKIRFGIHGTVADPRCHEEPIPILRRGEVALVGAFRHLIMSQGSVIQPGASDGISSDDGAAFQVHLVVVIN
eukprot:SAG11_NODE_1581_length_4648_cov_3.265993_3_plen_175_part_00